MRKSEHLPVRQAHRIKIDRKTSWCQRGRSSNYLCHCYFITICEARLPNKTVDVIGVAGVAGEHHVITLARAPTSDLILEYEGNISCSQYVITDESDSKRDLFLVTEKSADGTITGINYSDRYYSNDQDFI